MFLNNLLTKIEQKVDIKILVCKSLLKLGHNDKLEIKDKIDKDKLQDNALACEYMVAFAKNFYKIEETKRVDSMNEQVKGIINELYKEQISKNKKLISNPKQ